MPGEDTARRLAKLKAEVAKLEAQEREAPAQIDEIVRLVVTEGVRRPPFAHAMSMAEIRRRFSERSPAGLTVAVHRARGDGREINVEGVPYVVRTAPRARRGHAEVVVEPTLAHSAVVVTVGMGGVGDLRTQELSEIARVLALRPADVKKRLAAAFPRHVLLEGATWGAAIEEGRLVARRVRVDEQSRVDIGAASEIMPRHTGSPAQTPRQAGSALHERYGALCKDMCESLHLGFITDEDLNRWLKEVSDATGSLYFGTKAFLLQGHLLLALGEPKAAQRAFLQAEEFHGACASESLRRGNLGEAYASRGLAQVKDAAPGEDPFAQMDSPHEEVEVMKAIASLESVRRGLGNEALIDWLRSRRDRGFLVDLALEGRSRGDPILEEVLSMLTPAATPPSEKDAREHLELGRAYADMGLADEARGEFVSAMGVPAFAAAAKAEIEKLPSTDVETTRSGDPGKKPGSE